MTNYVNSAKIENVPSVLQNTKGVTFMTMFEIRKEDELEQQHMYELQDSMYEVMVGSEEVEDETETTDSFIRRMNRQEKKRRKTSREYPGTLSYNAMRHSVEYMDNISIRRKAPERVIAKYLSGGYAMDMAE